MYAYTYIHVYTLNTDKHPNRLIVLVMQCFQVKYPMSDFDFSLNTVGKPLGKCGYKSHVAYTVYQ